MTITRSVAVRIKTGVFGDAGKRFQKLGFQPPVSKLAADVFIQDRSIGFFIFKQILQTINLSVSGRKGHPGHDCTAVGPAAVQIIMK